MATTTRRKDITLTGTPVGRAGWRGLVALAVLASVACDSNEAPTAPEVEEILPGSLSVTTVTTGFMKDSGYELFVNGESQGTIGADDEVTLSDLDPAAYEVSLGDVADNCSVAPGSVEVASEQTATVTLAVLCEAGDPVSWTIQVSKQRPDLDTDTVVVCNFGLCPSDTDWDLYLELNSSSDPQSVIRQNQSAGVEIAHLADVPLADLAEEDVDGATFSTEPQDRAFSSGSTILLRTTAGNIYALGNPVEEVAFGSGTLTFDALLVVPAS